MGDFRPRRKKVCKMCQNKIDKLDYKDVETVRRYISDKGNILPRRITGTCAKHQRMVAETVKRARHMALVPFAE